MNLIGKRFGKLVVLYDTKERKDGRIIWHCICDCGKECNVKSSNLIQGRTKSCGCLQKEKAKKNIEQYNIDHNILDLTNKKFGRLIVLYQTNKRKNGSIIWKCKCSCGNFCEVSSDCLINGKTKSCGCLRKEIALQKSLFFNNQPTKGEAVIIDILKKEQIDFIREKSFLNSDKRIQSYRFDFYLPKFNICIEYDGEQHFKYINYFYKSRQDFLKAQERDRRKNSYALSNNISLYRIPYWEIKNIKQFKDILQDKFLVKDKWHCDNVARLLSK